MTTGMGIVHGILSQLQHFLPSWPPMLAKNKQLQGWFGPNDMFRWLEIAAEALQSQNWFMSNIHKTWHGNRTRLFHPDTPFSTKLTPKFGQKWTVCRLLWPKLPMCMIADCFRSIPKCQNEFTNIDYKAWDGNRTCYFKSTTTFSTKLTPSFGQKQAAPGLIWPKQHVCMVADCCRSTPESKLVHETALQSLGWELCMVFLSKHTIYCQADPQIWKKKWPILGLFLPK